MADEQVQQNGNQMNDADRAFYQRMQRLAVMSYITSRYGLAQALGKTFGGDRNLYEVLGYKVNLHIEDFRAKYYRNGRAKRIVNHVVRGTWRQPPLLKDSEWDPQIETSLEDRWTQPTSTAFTRAWSQLVNKRHIFHYIRRADILSRIGRFSLLVLGFQDRKPLSAYLQKGSLRGPGGLVYLAVYGENSVEVHSFDTDPHSERNGLPAYYIVSQENVDEHLPTRPPQTVHPDRAIHFADELLEDDVYAVPPLESEFNWLEDLEKTVGGAAEGTWQAMYKGIQADMAENYYDDAGDLEDQLDEYFHGIRRFLKTRGVTLSDLGGEVIDPTGLYKIITALNSSGSEIPQRIMEGAELGHLASTQDGVNWASIVEERRNNFAEPRVIRPLVDQLIYAGVLPEPENGVYEVVWSDPRQMTEQEQANIDKIKAETQKTQFEAAQYPRITRWRMMGHDEEFIAQATQDAMIEQTLMPDVTPPVQQ